MSKPIHAKPVLYAYYYEALKTIARELGYNLLLHGSAHRDLDLVAVPWVNDPADHIALIHAIDMCINGTVITTPEGNDVKAYSFSVLPGGRSAYVININRSGRWNNYSEDPQYYIDLSITPLVIEG